jgi:hypothetical protein
MIEKILLEVPVLSAVTFALTAWVKQLGFQGKQLTLAAFAIGLVLGVCYRFAVSPMTDFAGWFFAVLYGLMCGAVATGAYKGADGLASKRP